MFDNEKGISEEEAKRLLSEHGLNVLPENKPPSEVRIFISQMLNPLVYVLLFAGLATIVLGHYSDTVIIFLSVLVNTIVGYIQESGANKSLMALKKLVTQKVEVIRGGIRKTIESAELVPGDVVVLSPGVKIPADGSLVFANRLYIDEAVITGESVPVSKELSDEVYTGSVVTSGQALFKVNVTGSKTRMGAIAMRIQEPKESTPLGKQLERFSKKLVVLIVFLSLTVFLIGIFRGNSPVEMFTTVVALAVSSIPEGLLVTLTVVLAIGMQRILKRRGLVRKLASAETLGGVSVICVDKTGTLTEGKMQVSEAFGNVKEIARQVVVANDLDDPMVISAFEWGKMKYKEDVAKYPRLDSIPFSSAHRFFLCLNRWSKDSNVMFVNGAPDVLLDYADLDIKQKEEIRDQIERLSSQGKRLLGFARKEVSPSKKRLDIEDAKGGLTWIGLVALSDPVRPSVKNALAIAKDAGIQIKVITGDYAGTSEFVLTELGIPVNKDEIVLGENLEKMSVSELSAKLSTIKLFARTTPEQKLKIVEALKNSGEVVAMMGDGVNDAPALHKSDIGIVVSEASDVSRETADLVLLDSNFSTIVESIEEGRGMFENIRKVILYLLSDAFAEIIVVVGGIVLGLPLPITAVQIIWINLISDGLPSMTLTIDPKRPGLMNEKPRSGNERLINHWMIYLIGLVSISAGLMALAVFIVSYKMTGDALYARSLCFATLGLNSLSYVFSVRSLLIPFWKNHLFENKWLILAVAVGFLLQVFPFSTEGVRGFFGVVPIGVGGWVTAVVLSISVFFVVEVFKLAYKTKPQD